MGGGAGGGAAEWGRLLQLHAVQDIDL